MTSKLKPWIKLPSRWIEMGGLQEFKWLAGEGANNIAALMMLAVISHHADSETGIAKLTYDQLSDMASLSRIKVSRGLSLLSTRKLITREPLGQSSYHLSNYNPKADWVQFPANGLYHDGIVQVFRDFQLRQSAELNALKLYFLFASRRDRKTNMANITYEKIEHYTGIPRNSIKRALSFLAAVGLVHTEFVPSSKNEYGVANAYRLAHLYSHKHMGTLGRSLESADFISPQDLPF